MLHVLNYYSIQNDYSSDVGFLSLIIMKFIACDEVQLILNKNNQKITYQLNNTN